MIALPPPHEETILTIALTPLDPLLFGDNRSARAGLDHLTLDQDPSPLTLHGAVGQWLVDSLGGWSQAEGVLGPRRPDVLAASNDIAQLVGYAYRAPSGRLLFPRPLHFTVRRAVSGALEASSLLEPRALPAGSCCSCAYEQILLSAEPDERETDEQMFVDEDLLAEILTGRPMPRHQPLSGRAVARSDVFAEERRPGLAIRNQTGTAEPGLLFSRPYRRFQRMDDEPWPFGIAAWLATCSPVEVTRLRETAFVGGDRRRCRAVATAGESVPLGGLLQSVIESAEGSAGFLAYLLTPSIVADDPPSLADGHVRPLAAAIGRQRQVSGWSSAPGRNQPRETLPLIPEGSVFFYRWPAGIDRRSLIEQCWLGSVSPIGGAVGFGRVLIGVWSGA